MILDLKLNLQKTGNIATISVKHNKGIVRVEYNWNDNDKKIVNGDSKNEVMINNISIPSGISNLHVVAVDINGKDTKMDFACEYDGIAIDLAVVNNSDMKITASDVTGMAYMTYKWNSDEEKKIFPNEEGDISIEQMTEIPSGLNTLYVTAVNSDNISLTKKQEVKGNKRPEIQRYIKGNDLHIIVTDEEGIDTVKIQVNANPEETFEVNGEKEFTHVYPIGEERMLVTITATDVEGVSRTLKGKKE
ncbi:MAG: hypothetical protein HFJ51_01005 [Clostridia bacterium]|nr:hypothetical protein [Clostridia bacterium]